MKREESPEETLARLGVRVLPPPPNGAHYGKVNRRNGGSPPQPTTTFASPSKQPNVELVLAEAIEPTPIDWLWDGWLAKGKLQVLAGQPGTGKTTLALATTAITSIGGVWPDGSQATAGNVVIWSGEDDPADTLVPRLIAAGADRSRVYFVKGVSEDGGKRSFDPAKDMGPLSQAMERIGDVKLVIIDPIAMVAVKDSHRNAETRRDLQPVADLCQATGAAGLGIHHLAKGTVGREPHERLIGSIAFAAVARVVMIATKTPPREGERNERRVLIRAKSNVGPDEGGYVYSLEQTELSGYPIFASCVLWGEAIEGTAREVLAEAELVTHRGHYSTGDGTIRVTYGSSRKSTQSKSTQIGGMSSAPGVLARIMLAELAREALGIVEGED